MGLKVTNNAYAVLNASITSSSTTIVLVAGQGARFPTLSAGDYFYATLIDTSNNLEIVKVTARSTDTLTVVRGQDNTTARAYATNDRFELRPTAVLLTEVITAAEGALPKAGGTMTGPLVISGDIGDGTPTLTQTITSTPSSYNWSQKAIASGIGANKHIVQVIGQAESSYNAAFWGYKHVGAGDQANNKAVFGMYSKNNIIELDGYGRVVKQYQPFFYAQNGDESGDGVTTNPFRFSSVVHNVGGGFVTSGTGALTRFIAPVSGVYVFSTNPGYKQTGSDFVCRFRVNGGYLTDLIRLIGYPNSHSGGSYTIVVRLNATDYVDLASDGSTYHRNNAAVPNFFSGYLLG
jgi:hypothetical protein